MSAYVLTAAAAADLEQIERFLDEHAAHATDAVLDALDAAMLRIAAAPGLGHVRDDLAAEPLRFVSVFSYLVIHRAARPVEVVRVLHGARDVARELRRGR